MAVRKSPREPAAALTIPPSAVGSIMIHRTQCYGTCPDYWAFIHSDGSVVYNGEAYVDHKGLRTGRVPAKDARALLGLASANGYFDSERDYSPGVTDNATVYTSVTVEGREHVVRNYARGAPGEVQAVEAAIDALLELTTWDPEPMFDAKLSGHACEDVDRELATRCDDYLSLTGTPGSCPFWFELRAYILQGHEDAGQRACEQVYRALLMTPAARAPAPNQVMPKLGPKCRSIIDGPIAGCKNALAREKPSGPCDGIDRAIKVVKRAMEDDDPALGEYSCELTRDWHPGWR